jgi:hypothetical protein
MKILHVTVYRMHPRRSYMFLSTGEIHEDPTCSCLQQAKTVDYLIYFKQKIEKGMRGIKAEYT